MIQIVRFGIFLVLLSFLSCANPKGITGGPKDTIAPKLIKVVPQHKATNFNSRVLILEFDEWIKINNLQKELLITPSIKGTYKVKDYKKKVVLEFEKPFDTSTTYTLNFRKGIQDITEGNPVKNLQIVFSTGSNIDSLQISGSAKLLLSNAPASECSVWLSPADDTLQVDKHLPYYLTQTDKSGNFRLQNLKAGKYDLFVFQDKNSNNILNPEQEMVGFTKESIVLDSLNKDTLNIEIALMDRKAAKILRFRPSNTQTDKSFLDFHKGIVDIEIESSAKIAYQIAENGKEVMLYNLEKKYDSLELKIKAIDSLGNQTDTSRKILFLKELRSGKSKKDPFKMKLKNLSQGEGVLPNLELEIAFSKPVEKENFKKIKFFKDQDSTQAIALETKDIQWNKYKTELSIRKNIPFKEEIRLQIDSAAFESVEQEPSPPLEQRFEIKNPIRFATIKLEINTDYKNYIIELLDNKKKPVRRFDSNKETLPNNRVIVWEYLPALNYQIRAIIDENKNGKWDTGDYKKRVLPEKIIFLPKELSIRENWEVSEKFSF
ncbi:MAG: Ig-like domain-containing protein [Raineya sp.]